MKKKMFWAVFSLLIVALSSQSAMASVIGVINTNELNYFKNETKTSPWSVNQKFELNFGSSFSKGSITPSMDLKYLLSSSRSLNSNVNVELELDFRFANSFFSFSNGQKALMLASSVGLKSKITFNEKLEIYTNIFIPKILIGAEGSSNIIYDGFSIGLGVDYQISPNISVKFGLMFNNFDVK